MINNILTINNNMIIHCNNKVRMLQLNIKCSRLNLPNMLLRGCCGVVRARIHLESKTQIYFYWKQTWMKNMMKSIIGISQGAATISNLMNGTQKGWVNKDTTVDIWSSKFFTTSIHQHTSPIWQLTFHWNSSNWNCPNFEKFSDFRIP